MTTLIENHIRKIIEIGCKIKKYDNLIIFLPEESKEIEDIFLKLRFEYKINKIIFVKNNYQELYNFLIQNPTEEEIKKYITKYPKINKNFKLINFYSEDYKGYYYKLNYEIYNKYFKYLKLEYEINQETYDILKNIPKVITPCPTYDWANNLFGSNLTKEELWNLIIKTVPSKEKLQEEIKRLNNIKEYLNKLAIKELYFYTEKGTDLRLSLTKNSSWISNTLILNNVEYFPNFPSYEIFTAPDYTEAEGKVIINKASSLYGIRIENAELAFLKGKLISCKSDNEKWNRIVMNEKNGLNRIGEIALVSKDNPIANLNYHFKSQILDENTGCHLALGNAYKECTKIPSFFLNKIGMSHYNLNNSKYHQDLIFGDDSTVVEAKTKNKTLLLMKDGKWQI